MSCNLQYSNNKLVQVVNDQGQPSQLYREAVSKFGEEKALDIFLTSKSDNFTDIFGKDEPSLQTVMKYITEENKITEPLNKEQIVDLQDFDQNISVDALVNTFYDEFGIFSVSAGKLKASKLYSDYEIRNLQNDVELQEKVKLSLEALINTENAEELLPQQLQTEKTGIINSFGKLVSINPEIIEKEIVEKLGGTTQDEFNQIVEDIDYPKFQDSLQKPVDKSLIKRVIDQLKKTKLANNVFVLSNKEIVNKLVELGVSEKLAKQVVAWHGSPYSFDKFTTNAMGTGEGAQSFGWGLYFTDLESIARNYAKVLSNKNSYYVGDVMDFKYELKDIFDKYSFSKNFKFPYIDSNGSIDPISLDNFLDQFSKLKENYNKNKEVLNEKEKKAKGILPQYIEQFNKLYKNFEKDAEEFENFEKDIKEFEDDFDFTIFSNKNLYKATLHKGKEAGEYTWLEWDKEIPKNQLDKISENVLDKTLAINTTNIFQFKKDGKFYRGEKINNEWKFIDRNTGESVEYSEVSNTWQELYNKEVLNKKEFKFYKRLEDFLESDKNASLFLLENGIDGIKYPAESISRGATSDTARGFNYVVFDENAVTVDEKIQFQKDITLTSSGFVHKGDVFLNNDVMKLDTPVHEFGHLYLNWLKSERGDLYQKGLELAQSKDAKEYADYVEKTQPNLAGEDKLNEILAQAIGDNGAKLADKSWIGELWDEIKKLFGLSQYTIKQIQNMNLEQFTKAIAVDLYKEDLFKQMQEYKKADVFIEVEGEIRQKNNVETEITIPLTTKIITNEAIKDSLDNLLNINLDILSDNYEQTEKVLTAIENELISNGLDVVGLSKKPIDSELIEFLKELTIFINSPTRENTKSYANLSDEYFERDITPQKTVVKTDKKLEYVTLNTTLSEEEVYTKSGLIKVKDNLYIKSAKESLEKLYSNLETYTEKYPKDKTIQEYVQEQIAKTKGFNNAENAEAIYLYKMYFGIEDDAPKRNAEGKLLAPNGKPSNLTEEQYKLVRTPEFKAWFGDWENNPQNASKVVDENGEPLVVYHGSPYSGITEFNREESVKNKSGLNEIGTYFATNRTLSEAYKNWSTLNENTTNSIDKEIEKWREIRYSSRSNRDFITAGEEIEKLTNLKNGKVYSAFLNLRKVKDFDAKGEENIEAWNNLEVKASYKWAKNRDAMEFLKDGKFGVEKVDGIHAKNIVDAFVQGDEKLKKDFLGDVYLVFDGNEGMIKSATEIKGTTSTETNDIRYLKSVTPINSTQNFTGDAEYLTGEFISDFWAKALKAKQKDNADWRNYYSHFGVNERGLYLINDDSITMSKIELYADENIKQYSILSKQMPNIADKSEGIQSLRDEAINNPNSVKVFEGQVSRLNEKEIVLKDSADEFVRIGDDIFENIATESNLKHYVKLEKNNSEYYVVNTEKPKSELKLSDYKYLETTTDKFTTVKKYLANQNLEEFNC